MADDLWVDSGLRTSIAISSMKGGSGKTTLTLNMAEYFAGAGHKVLIIDIDPQAQACLYFSSAEQLLDENQIKLLDLLTFIIKHDGELASREQTTTRSEVREELRENFFYSLIHRGSNLSIIASTPELYQVEPLIQAATATTYLMEVLIRQAYENYDIVIVDCPPTITTDMVKSTYAGVRNLVIPTDATKFGYYGLERAWQWYVRTRRIHNTKLNLAGIIITKYVEQRTLHRIVHDEITESLSYGDYVLLPPLPHLADFERSMHTNQYIGTLKPEGKAAKAFIEVMEKLETKLEFEKFEDVTLE